MRKLAGILTVVALLEGCGTVAEYYRADPIMRRNLSSGAPSYYSKDGNSVDVTNPEFATKVASINTKDGRNQLVRELMSVSDDVCELHKAKIIANSNTWNISTGTISSVLSGLGSVAGGEATKAGLSAGAALTNATRSLVNQEIYANSLATTIVRAIELKRTEARSAIETALEGKDIASYPVWTAIYDIDEYHRRCSFINGLVEVTRALDTRKESRAQLLFRIQVLKNQLSSNKSLDSSYDPKALMTEIEKLQVLLSSAPD
ncbi:hypothetical protein [Zoogloea sp.]|uniref:hypothetical protein n=1 Tax=Zoogloea sp. TaxID=49181 RepID=UPI0035AEC31F